MPKKKGKQVFLDGLNETMQQAVKGASKDFLNYDMPDHIAASMADRFSEFFGGMLEEFTAPGAGSRKRSSLPEGGAGEYVNPDYLEGRKGLFVEFPLMVPVVMEEGELSLDLERFDIGQEVSVLLEEWEEGAVPIKVYTQEGGGPCYLLDPSDVSVNLSVGDQHNARSHSSRGTVRASSKRVRR